MKIIVKRFCLSHNGEIYTAGDVVEIEDSKTAKRLVARSGGTLEIYHGDDLADVEDVSDENADIENEDGGTSDENADIENEDGGTSDDVSDSDSEDGAGGIPTVDPTASVQTDGSEKGEGRGKKK